MNYARTHQDNVRTYNNMAGHYDTSFDGRFTKKFKEALVRAVQLTKEDKVLDVACGNATLLAMFAEEETIQGYGVDISDQMIAAAKSRYPKMNLSVASCEKLPFEDEAMNVVTVSASYHHFPDVAAFAKEAKRVLKPGGRIYIAEVHLVAPLRILANFFMPLLRLGDVKLYSPEEIRATFVRAGFMPEGKIVQGLVQVLSFTKS